jgi:hypothetical protein
LGSGNPYDIVHQFHHTNNNIGVPKRTEGVFNILKDDHPLGYIFFGNGGHQFFVQFNGIPEFPILKVKAALFFVDYLFQEFLTAKSKKFLLEVQALPCYILVIRRI